MISFPNADLTPNEAIELWCKTKTEYAKEQVILSNVGLIVFVINRLNANILDEDLWSLGLFALTKATMTYNPKKATSFGTYAIACIKNELLMEYRKNAKKKISIYLDAPMQDVDNLTHRDLVPDNKDYIQDTLTKVEFFEFCKKLSERERKIIEMKIDNKNQNEIAKELNLSQSYITRLLAGIKEKYEMWRGV